MRNAYAMNNYTEAKEALQKIFLHLEPIDPSAARSLQEGLEEMLTVHRLGIGAVLRRKPGTANPIESCLSTVQRVARNVKRWRKFGPCARNISSNPIGNPNEPKMSTRHSNLIALLCPLEISKFLLAPSVSHGITC
jgi:hypothetical protein